MPRYLGGSVSIGLSTTELLSTTSTPLNNVGREARSKIDSHVQKFTESFKENRLYECALGREDRAFPRLQFIGDGKQIPFFFLKASIDTPMLSSSHSQTYKNVTKTNEQLDPQGSGGTPTYVKSYTNGPFHTGEFLGIKLMSSRSISDQNGMRASSTRSTRNGTPDQRSNAGIHSFFKPQALCLSVELSGDCFISPPSNIKVKESNLSRFDIKVDVFYNGEFAGSQLISSRRNKKDDASSEQLLFHGRRTSRLQEIPWVLVPAGQNADGTMRELRRIQGGEAGTHRRWESINENLNRHAASINAGGAFHSALSEYLSHVAALPQPKNLQRPGGLKFGTIDVVLSLGKGQKDGSETKYMLDPVPIRVKPLSYVYKDLSTKLRSVLINANNKSNGRIQNPRDEIHQTSSPLLSSRSEQIGKSSPKRVCENPEPVKTAKKQCTGVNHMRNEPKLFHLDPATPRSTSTDQKWVNQPLSSSSIRARQHENLAPDTGMPIAQKKFTGGIFSTPQSQQLKKRRANRTYGTVEHVWTTELTESERIELIAHQAEITAHSEYSGGGPRATRNSSATFGSSPGERPKTSIPNGKQEEFFVTSERTKTEFGKHEQGPVIPKNKNGDLQVPSQSSQLSGSGEIAESTIKPIKYKYKPPAQVDFSNKKQDNIADNSMHPPLLKCNALHDDCVITYAGDVLRQIPSERGGQFAEHSILMGVRYIIG